MAKGFTIKEKIDNNEGDTPKKKTSIRVTEQVDKKATGTKVTGISEGTKEVTRVESPEMIKALEMAAQLVGNQKPVYPIEEYAKAILKLKGKYIVFCMPGRMISYAFMKNFMQLCFDLFKLGAGFTVSQDYSSMVNFARCKCLGAHVLRGPDQKPWDGKIKYDYQMWIDSDIIFNTLRFLELVIMDKDIASGWYMTEDGVRTSVAHWSDEKKFRENGGMMTHETGETMQNRTKPFTVDYIGFGWVLIKHGVFENEKIKYPWFAPELKVFEDGAVADMCGEDVSFCLNAIEAGYEIWCHPAVRVGHEKMRVI